MIFQWTIDKVLSGEKTATRRLVKPGQCLLAKDWNAAKDCGFRVVHSTVYGFHKTDSMGELAYFNGHKDRVIYEVGKTYAAQPGRTQKAVARIRITRIRQEDIRNISDSDVRAEGFTDYLAFLKVWLGMHDKVFAEHLPEKMNPVSLISNKHGIRDLVMMRPAEYYLAWVIDFELVTP